MTTSDLKLKIFRQIDLLEKKRLEELYGVLVNFVNSKKDIKDWDKLSEEQKQGVFNAIKEIDSGRGITNEQVLAMMKNQFGHA